MRHKGATSADMAATSAGLPDQAEQLEGHRPHVFAQKALGYCGETMLIQLLSHLPYFFCWSQE